MTHSLTVIGCGYWGPNPVRTLRSLPGAYVSVISDKSRERSETLHTPYPEVETPTDLCCVTVRRADPRGGDCYTDFHVPCPGHGRAAVRHTFVHTNTLRKIKDFTGSGEIGGLMYISCRCLNRGL